MLNRVTIAILIASVLFASTDLANAEDAESAYPDESTIAIVGSYGCEFAVDYSVKLVQKGREVFLTYFDEGARYWGTGSRLVSFEIVLDFEQFKALWSEIQALGPSSLKDTDGLRGSTADFIGKLSIEYTTDEKSYSTEIKITGSRFEDENIEKLYRLVDNFKNFAIIGHW